LTHEQSNSNAGSAVADGHRQHGVHGATLVNVCDTVVYAAYALVCAWSPTGDHNCAESCKSFMSKYDMDGCAGYCPRCNLLIICDAEFQAWNMDI
jgi:hypothetical protein